jgi:5-oxoprolinase (ATP-hydrolysing)
MLDVGARVEGPAIITQRDSTTVLEPDFVAEVTASGALRLERR